MIDVGQARLQVQRRFDRNLGRWAAALAQHPAGAHASAGGADTSPAHPALVTVALHPPTEREMRADEAAAEAWAREWAAQPALPGVEVEWVVRSWRSIGRQRVPRRLHVADADAAASFIGGARARRWMLLRQRVTRLREITDSSAAGDALAAVVQRHVNGLAELSDDRFAQVTHVVEWIIDHPVAGLRPRQIPVRGVDSKWFGSHRRLVTDLVGAATGDRGLGLVDADPLVRLRALDEALAIGGLRDLSAPVSQLAALDITVRIVLVLENLESLLALPPRDGVLAVHGSGYAVDQVARLPWIRRARVLYWGDLDSNGFAILHRLRTALPTAASVLMDRETLCAHRDLWVAEPSPARGTYPTLTPGEQATLDLLRAEGDVRLEQERIPWEYALGHLVAAGV